MKKKFFEHPVVTKIMRASDVKILEDDAILIKDLTIFDDIEKEVLRLLKQSFQRFTRTKNFRTLMILKDITE